MSDTPKTDARELVFAENANGFARLDDVLDAYEFARRLEFQCNELQNALDRRVENDAKSVQSDSVVASCNCMTKTPKVKYHAKGCKYRLICERDELLDTVKAWQNIAYGGATPEQMRIARSITDTVIAKIEGGSK